MSEDCRELERLLGSGGPDSPLLAQRLEGHLESCQRCREELVGDDWVGAELARLPRVSPGPRLGERIRERTVLARDRQALVHGWPGLLGLAAGVAAAALLVLSLSPWSVRQQRAPRAPDRVETARLQARLSLEYTGGLIQHAQRATLSSVVQRQIHDRIDSGLESALRKGLGLDKGGS